MFQLGSSYSRGEIASAFGIKNAAEEQRAVFVNKGHAVAIVINAKGKHPSGRHYFNALTDVSFTMQGEDDDRGALIEVPGQRWPLFFSHGTDENYTFEGYVAHEITEDVGVPLRKYKRVKG